MSELASEAVASSTHREIRIPTWDGHHLGARVYDPEPGSYSAEGTRGTVLINGATAVPQTYYQRFARFAAYRGYRVVTYDYRGIGASRSGPSRREPATMHDWGNVDAACAFAYARSITKGGPLVGIGHSFGGQTIGLTDSWRGADAAVLVASQLGYWGHWPPAVRWRYAAMWYGVVPAATAAFGHLPGWMGLGQDLPKGVAREWAKWCRHPHYLLGHEPQARMRFSRFEVPTLFFSFSDDEYAPPSAVDALVSLLPPKSVHHVAFTPDEVGGKVGHFGFFKPAYEAALWHPAVEWIDRAISGRRLS